MDIDAKLLERYARTRDADAFTQLVRRHAGMVFGVARRITRDHHDAEEVAQTCFLELARQAGAIRASGGSAAAWLHGVATNRAADCNRTAARRRGHERAAAKPEAARPEAGKPEAGKAEAGKPGVAGDATWDGIAPLVDAALAGLPDELRLPVVLYHLEGRGQAEIAAELGVNQSTVSRRVEAGVAALRAKLKAAGVTTAVAGLALVLAEQAKAAVPATLTATLGKIAVSGAAPALSTTIGGASASAAGKGSVSLMVKIAVGVVLAAAVPGISFALFRSAVAPAVPAPALMLAAAATPTQTPGIAAARQALIDRLAKLQNYTAAGRADWHFDEATVTTFDRFWFLDGRVKHAREQTDPETTAGIGGPAHYVPVRDEEVFVSDHNERFRQLIGQPIAAGVIGPAQIGPGRMIDFGLGLRRYGNPAWTTKADLEAAALTVGDNGLLKITAVTRVSTVVVQSFDPKLDYALVSCQGLAHDGRPVYDVTCSDFRAVNGVWVPFQIDGHSYSYSNMLKDQRLVNTNTLHLTRFDLKPIENTPEAYHVDWPPRSRVLDQVHNKIFRADAQGKLVDTGHRPNPNNGPAAVARRAAAAPTAAAIIQQPGYFTSSSIVVGFAGLALVIVGLVVRWRRA